MTKINRKNKFYITTPLYYVNASPHIGHSYTNIAADCLSRHMREIISGANVRLLTGTDEYGQKMQRAAVAAKMSPQEYADKMVQQFQGLWKTLNISNDDFIRTTEKRHFDTVQRALSILYEKKQIYSAQYEGLYCTPCETFWLPSQVINGLCPDCKRPVEKLSETNYFFKLSDHQEWLKDHIKTHPDFIKPSSRYEEVISFLDNKLNDLCISRPKERLSWGIPLPFSPSHVTYVWFDALLNYISAVGTFDEKGNYVSEWWQPDTQIVHVMGKDIVRQHAVYWPIMLRALGIRPPDTVLTHGWWLIADTKMSKSRGNVVSPMEMVDKFGVDVYRYFLLRDIPFGGDGNFSEEAIIRRFNSDLANDLGNLVYRTLTMVEKYFQGDVPVLDIGAVGAILQADVPAQNIIRQVKDSTSEFHTGVTAGFENYNFSQSLEHIWKIINMANKYIEDKKPWNLAKENKTEELKAFIWLLVYAIREIGRKIKPFMPSTSDEILRQVGETKVNKGKPLFPRIV